MQGSTHTPLIDRDLLSDFDREIWREVPHLEGGKVVNVSPLVELTQVLRESAKEVYGLDLSSSSFTVFGKSDASLLGGSVKTRPAVQIVRDAIASGKLRRGQVVFEATSGNFGISLGQLAKLGIAVVALVSRKLQQGVLDELEANGVKTVNLDVDICPAPGVQTDPNLLVARIVATSMRERFAELGLDLNAFDASRSKIEERLATQDVINLARVLADTYGGFCPSQYENELNVFAHESVTGPEVDQQLHERGQSMADFSVICAFGTGGTSAGLSRYTQMKYAKKSVHVVFPREGQDVAGIRTRSKASGLPFYQPALYAGQHEVDFEQARRLLLHLTREKALDIGESSALVLYSVLQMVNFGIEGKYLVILADGVKKYRQSLESESGENLEGKLEVTLDQARAHRNEYGAVVWTHPAYAPNEEGAKLVATALNSNNNNGSYGKDATTIEVAKAADVAQAVATRRIPVELERLVANVDGRVLLVCMSGNTSLKLAEVLSQRGVRAQSLTGGITNLAQVSGKPIFTLVKPAS